MSPTDLELVDATLEGDKSSFEALVRRHANGIFGLARGMLRNETEAQDVVQDTFLAAFRKLHTFRRESSFKSWLYRIASNTCLMRLRSKRRRPEVPLAVRSSGFDEDGHHERPVVDWSPISDERLETRELGVHIRAAVDELPEKYRVVLLLADYEKRSMKEIADALDLTVPNVKTRLHRARLAVRASLATYVAGER